ncbi:MAG: protein kinase, partial [Deltaproteobacteria bacterium]|nr:protein kinase [Deltaproteobacteria bacterium]
LNIIHRDISPHNAMVSYYGDTKLMDFGIAKAAERSTKTQAGTVKGKVAYMSPEQARGKVLDPRSDLFALAAVAWELLTNRRLFLRASDFETLTAVLKEDAVPPSKHRPEVDQELDDIIMTALEKDRDNRQASVEVFARELTRWYYKNVTDLEKESLKTYMQTLYAAKISTLPKSDAADLATVRSKPEAAPAARTPQKSAPVPMPEPTPRRPTSARQTAMDSEPKAGDAKQLARTVEASVPDVLKAQAPPRARGRTQDRMPQQPEPGSVDFANSATILEDGGPSQAEVMRALAEAAKKRGVPPPGQGDGGRGRGTEAVAQAPDGKKSSMMLWIIVGVVVVAGGTVAAILATGN